MRGVPAEVQAKLQDLMDSAPVDVSAAAQRLGLAIFQQALAQGVSGVLLRQTSFSTPSGFVILVNPKEAFVRQRFTAAHEIGHFVLHRDRVGERVEDNYMLRSAASRTCLSSKPTASLQTYLCRTRSSTS